MKKFLEGLKKSFSGASGADGDADTEYVQIEGGQRRDGDAKVIVRPFVLEDFSDTKTILEALRGQDTVALINIQPLKDKDIVELKRSINKLKKTVDAIGGDIAGFGDDYIVITPGFAQIWRAPPPKAEEEE
jgi:SepF-like predicted cell division protein (DUF552 family)